MTMPGRSSRAPSSRVLAAGLVLVGGLGTILAAAMAADDAWLSRAISALTVDPASAGLFRGTMAIVGLGFVALALRLRPIVRGIRARGLAGGPARLIVPWVGLMGVGFLGVALFPVDGPPWVVIAHGTAAYTPPILLMLGMLLARLAVPALGDRFGRASLALLALILVLYVTAVAGVLAWGAMELVVFIPAGIWLVAFVDRLERLDGPIVSPLPGPEPEAGVVLRVEP